MDETPNNEAENAPYFFLSHAHPPPPPTQSQVHGGPRGPIQRLFEKLWDHVGEICPPLAKDTDIGMIDSRIWLAEDWRRRLSTELARCKVLVPVVSPRFFASPWCGREWEVFEQRTARQNGVETDLKAIVPVHWVPLGEQEMPDFASRYQLWDGDFPRSYRTMGLYGLMARPGLREDCEESIYLLAERIKRVIQHTVTEVGEPVDVEKARNRFEGVPLTKFEHMLGRPTAEAGSDKDKDKTVVALPTGRGKPPAERA